MSTSKLPCIPSLRKQQLHLEFASLRRAAPPGVYVSLAPGDPTLWNGVIFVRSGPYASAVLRFQLRFPDTYPDLPPLVTFATDLFHPLIVPLTTYTFSTGSASDNPVSATDDERLPPGGFSLRHGFPHWFGRAKRSGLASGSTSRNVSGNSASVASTGHESSGYPVTDGDESNASNPPDTSAASEDGGVEAPRLAQAPAMDQFAERRNVVPVSEILDYIRSTFDDELVLDSLPVEPTGSSSGDWHWDGIWARRVKDEIENSHSEPMLFGGAARGGVDEMIRFSRLDDTTLNSVKEKMAAMAGNGI
ncbi:hypothetical protein N7530_009490 [Penicillium desertorum]|uniref:UBC core domain-containing protein n=1 Tax=Penicillium desertorum TaxID=1303715 RepID=A0A9X0BI85_9EURO|nr:hypothetical protein N7530_009490 [Penicillium desertorum]